MINLPSHPRPDFPYKEPSELVRIRQARPDGIRKARVEFADEALYDRIYGAWLGRCAGNLLGKPVEGWSREQIERYLTEAEAYPLDDYFPEPPSSEYRTHAPGALRGHINRALRDDDLDYTILNLRILEEQGLDFTSEDVASAWLNHLPYMQVYTAERAAYRNLVNGTSPPESARHRNPYREWIGAQIRADIWGYVTPGMPELGTELAHRDASVSHVKNGIYGEMFVSTMLSAAFVTDDIEEIIQIGLSEIPERSRLGEAVRNTVRWVQESRDWQDSWNNVMNAYGDYHWVHTLPNAAFVVLALIHGQGAFETTVAIAVMSGHDTDCNGATAGSIVGVLRGARALPESWIAPLNDRVESIVAGFTDSKISDLARRTAEIARNTLECR
ncbi:MAG: ADP-ribosylglycohydrolase family protein [Candidatus Bipolaricaulia bacterium]